jgi:hypothetical protein
MLGTMGESGALSLKIISRCIGDWRLTSVRTGYHTASEYRVVGRGMCRDCVLTWSFLISRIYQVSTSSLFNLVAVQGPTSCNGC